ncbi:hypothetical protein D3Z47_02300 [Lachnospiraceae bacterium]|nr:hypothetical protein [Lachnospiraceae bacterium]
MTDNEQIIRSYIKEVKCHFPVYKAQEKKFVDDLENAIMDFSNETKEFTYNELLNRFGSPKDLVANYLLEADAQYLSKEIRYSHHIKLISIFSAGMLIVSLTIVILLQYLFYYHARTSYISREITTIEEENNK